MSAASLFLLVVAVAVGAAVPLQSAINAQMAVSQGHPLYGALTNTAVATLALAALVVVFRIPAPSLRTAAAQPWWVWSGGLIGAAFVFGALFVAPRIGAAAFTAATIFGMVSAALVIDHFGLLDFPVQPLSFTRVAGSACVLLGILLLQMGRS